MKIRDLLKDNGKTLSFEIFPPNERVSLKSVMESAVKMTAFSPDFISVTYKSAGGSGEQTVDIAANLQNYLGIPSIAHLTCVTTEKREIDNIAREMETKGVENVLALRGDIPEDIDYPLPNHYRYAYELINRLHEIGDFSIGAACYPEGHIDTLSMTEDLKYLKHKVNCGTDFLISQMCFDNELFKYFLDRVRRLDINIPILVGIMPITNLKQLEAIDRLSDATIPKELLHTLEYYKEDPKAVFDAGIAYAVAQIIELLSYDIQGIHIYTMNKPKVAWAIRRQLGHVLPVKS